MFNSLPFNILKLQNDKPDFRVALQRYLITYTFYPLEDFSFTAKQSPLNPTILMYDVESIFTWHLNVYLFCVYYCVALSLFV